MRNSLIIPHDCIPMLWQSCKWFHNFFLRLGERFCLHLWLLFLVVFSSPLLITSGNLVLWWKSCAGNWDLIFASTTVLLFHLWLISSTFCGIIPLLKLILVFPFIYSFSWPLWLCALRGKYFMFFSRAYHSRTLNTNMSSKAMLINSLNFSIFSLQCAGTKSTQ